MRTALKYVGRAFLALIAALVIALTLNASYWTSYRAPMTLVAHRGLAQTYHREDLDNETCTATRIYPPQHPYLENTIASMQAAFDAGADIVEFDVHPTTDGAVRRLPRLDHRLPHARQGRHAHAHPRRAEGARHRLRLHRRRRQDVSVPRQGRRPDAVARRSAGRVSGQALPRSTSRATIRAKAICWPTACCNCRRNSSPASCPTAATARSRVAQTHPGHAHDVAQIGHRVRRQLSRAGLERLCPQILPQHHRPRADGYRLRALGLAQPLLRTHERRGLAGLRHGRLRSRHGRHRLPTKTSRNCPATSAAASGPTASTASARSSGGHHNGALAGEEGEDELTPSRRPALPSA